VVVAESGIKTPADVERLTFLGVHAMLVGESLLKQKDLETAARTILAAAGKRGIK
jgi:indole-3-glycerol phosphate synthase